MHPRSYRLIAVGLWALLSATVPGCGGSPMKTAPVKGKITYDGKAVSRGVVMFVPIRPGPTALGEIQADGSYKLTTFHSGDGAVPGTHLVVVDAKAEERLNASGLGDTPPAIVPHKYLSHATTDLRAEVQDGENNLDFNLTGALFKSRATAPDDEFFMKKKKAGKSGKKTDPAQK